ncbi:MULTISPECIES: LysR substrate-binding domain-containing protein [unclassified Mesorhizobium]|uniref:LysR substrate-binding domain-containing protein n=1 Tax=unclassified Mesorhizobium TaxID=325217 RepID=UPI0030143FCA
MRINPRQVEAFRNVMLAGGITSAAELMNITQPAVSRLIRDFEYAVKLKLFEREGSRFAPRDEAVKLYREVERLYLGLDQIGRAADDIKTAKGGFLRIGSVPALSPLCANEILPDLTSEMPDISIVFDTESTNHITDMIASHQYDVGFVFGGAERKGPPGELIAKTTAVAVLSPDHRLARNEAISVKDMADCRAIIPGRKTPLRISFEQIAGRNAVTFKSPIETSIANCCALAAKGMGVGIVDEISALSFGGELTILPFKPDIVVSYLAIRPPQAPKSRVVEMFTERLKEAVLKTLGATNAGRRDSSPAAAKQ